MTFKSFTKKLLTTSCVYFTIVMLFYIIITALVNVSEDSLILLEAGRTVLFFVFAVLLSLANNLFSLKNLSATIRVILHYLICAFAFYACFMLPVNMSASGILVGLVIFSVLYFAILGTITAFKAKYHRNTEKAQAYEQQYQIKK